MNRCLCCGKILDPALCKSAEIEYQWHEKCCFKFFGTRTFPKISITKEQLEQLAAKYLAEGFAVTGVQKKLSLHLSQDRERRLTLVGYPAGFILKPQADDYDSLPELENLVMNMAKSAGIQTVPQALLSVDGELVYITRRIDRHTTKTGTLCFAMEDFCQLSLRLTEEKYKSSCERCARVIKEYSSRSGLDLADFFYRLLFCFVTGNSDMHLKNFSLIESAPGSREFILSPAYDLLPVNVILPEDTEESALTINGKKSKLKSEDFLDFACHCGISAKSTKKMIQKLLSLKEKFYHDIENSFLKEALQHKMMELLENRMARLQ